MIEDRVRVGDIDIGYSIHGDRGDWVLLIQGLAYARWGWAWNAPALGEHFRVISFDNRGIGATDAPPGPYTVAQMAADATGLLDALGVERAHVVGASLGGFIAQEVALSRPDLVDRLVLACTGPGGAAHFPMPEITVRLIELAPSLPDEERLRRFIENGFTPAGVAHRQDLVEAMMTYRRETAQPLEAYTAQWNAGATFDASDRAGAIRAETLVLTGEQDNVVDPGNAKLLADTIPNARAMTLPGGHVFFVEHAELFNDTVTGFLKGGFA